MKNNYLNYNFEEIMAMNAAGFVPASYIGKTVIFKTITEDTSLACGFYITFIRCDKCKDMDDVHNVVKYLCNNAAYIKNKIKISGCTHMDITQDFEIYTKMNNNNTYADAICGLDYEMLCKLKSKGYDLHSMHDGIIRLSCNRDYFKSVVPYPHTITGKYSSKGDIDNIYEFLTSEDSNSVNIIREFVADITGDTSCAVDITWFAKRYFDKHYMRPRCNYNENVYLPQNGDAEANRWFYAGYTKACEDKDKEIDKLKDLLKKSGEMMDLVSAFLKTISSDTDKLASQIHSDKNYIDKAIKSINNNINKPDMTQEEDGANNDRQQEEPAESGEA